RPSPPRRCSFFSNSPSAPRAPPSFPTRRSSDPRLAGLLTIALSDQPRAARILVIAAGAGVAGEIAQLEPSPPAGTERGFELALRSEEHTSELQSLTNLVCRLLLEKKKHTRDHCAEIKTDDMRDESFIFRVRSYVLERHRQ